LAGNYLKSLQLAKQLEERAREATKNKERAEKEYDKLKLFLEACRENDADIHEAERILGEYNAAMASKDYQTALGHLSSASKEAKNAFIKRIGDIADSTDALVTLANIPGSDAKGARELLEKSKELVLRDDLEGAMDSAKSAYDAAERALHEHFSELFSQAQEVIMQAKDIGDDVGLFEDLLGRAKSSLEKQEYETALVHVREALEGAGENVKIQTNTAISSAEELISAGEELKADMSRVKAHIERSKNALEALRFKESLAYAKRAESEGESAIASRFQESTREIREGIRKLKSVGEDVDMPQELIDQAQEAMKEKRYIEALRALNVAGERIREMQFKSVLAVIAQAKDRFVLAKKVGVDMTKAILLLNTSRDNLRLGKFEDAVQYAEQSRKEIDDALQVFYEARDQLVELAKAIKLAEDMESDVSALKRTMADAKKLFETKDYEKALEIIKEGMTDVRKATYDRAIDSINNADKAVKLAKATGADDTEAEGLLERALASMSKENMPEAIKLAGESLEAANSSMTRVISDRIHNLDEFVKAFQGTEDLSPVVEIISEARLRLSDMAFDKAYDLLKEAQQKIETAGREESERLILLAEQKLEEIRAMGGEVDDLEILMKRAREGVEEKVFEEATARAREVVDHSDETMVKLLQADFSAVKDSIEEAKSIGIDIEEAKNGVKDARVKFEDKDFVAAHNTIKGVRTSLGERIERYDRIKEKIRKADDLISEAQRNKADVSEQLKLLDSAKNKFVSGAYDEAEPMLDKLVDETEKKLAMYLAARLILTSKESIDLANSNDIDVSEPMGILNKARELMKKKDYDEALNLAKQATELTKEITETSVDSMITDLRRLVTDAKNVGVDTSGPEVLTEKAAASAKSGDFTEALKCISSAKADIDQIRNLSSQAAVEIKVARNSLKDAETLDMDVGRAREMLEQAVDALTRHQYAIALELAKRSSEASQDVTRNTIWNTLEKFKDRIEKAASNGVAVGLAEECVAEGIKAFNDEKYQEALKLAMKCETEMDRAELQRDISTRAVEMARRKLTDAATEGINTPELVGFVEEAEAMLTEARYVDALGKALESGDLLHQIRNTVDTARIELSAAREQVERLRKVGIDTSECDKVIEEAQKHLADHELMKCRELLSTCSEKTVTVFENAINEVMSQNEELISKAKSMGLDTKQCENLLEVARTSFFEKLWDFSYQQAETCRKTCIEVISKKITKLVDETSERVKALSEMGAAVSSVQGMLDQANAASTGGNAQEAFQLLMEAEQRILGIEDSHKKYIDISLAAESSIEMLKRIGISAGESERLLALADVERDKDYDSAIEFVAEALDSAKDTIESYAPEIDVTVSSEGLQEGVEGDIELRIKNTGNTIARDISIELSGQFKIADLPVIGGLKPDAEVLVKAKVVPDVSGEISVRVNARYKRHFDGTAFTSEKDAQIAAFGGGPSFKISRATEASKCTACHGKIKPGFDIVDCRCGNQTHLSCAKRAGKCPVCSQKYEF